MAEGEAKTPADPAQPTALLIIPGGGSKAERVLARFLQMVLEYRYGLEIVLETNVRHAVQTLGAHTCLHSVYLIQGQPVSVNSTVPILTDKGRLPLFILQPRRVADQQRAECEKLEGVHVCVWESAFGRDEASLTRILAAGLARADSGLGGGDPEERVRRRLRKLNTLPTLPTVLGRLMRLLSDPKTQMSHLEVLLSSEPAIALKIRQVANSAAVAGASGRSVATLKEAITRLGTRKVGAIGQQIALINSLVRPDDSGFDLRRYWGHSLASAIVADKVHNGKFVALADKVPFNDYWIAALLHDCGKAVQGFFFYDWFERITETMDDEQCSFYEAENGLGEGMVTHDRISAMVLQKAEMPEELIEAVALHHEPGDTPSPLVALIHVANGMCSEMGYGWGEGSSVEYSRPALKALGLKREAVREIVESLREPVGKELREVVSQCLGD